VLDIGPLRMTSHAFFLSGVASKMQRILFEG
jgi:hypothetical protein